MESAIHYLTYSCHDVTKGIITIQLFMPVSGIILAENVLRHTWMELTQI